MVKPPLIKLTLTLLVDTVALHLLNPLQVVAMEQDPDHIGNSCVLSNQEALVLGLSHEDTVMDADQATLPHLEGELALSPWMT